MVVGRLLSYWEGWLFRGYAGYMFEVVDLSLEKQIPNLRKYMQNTTYPVHRMVAPFGHFVEISEGANKNKPTNK